VAGNWQHLRTTFESAAGIYQQARPDYPRLSESSWNFETAIL